MATITIFKEIHVDVDVSDLGTEELIEAVESLGYLVYDRDDSDAPDTLKDKIRLLREDFINWKDYGMTNENFEAILKSFFKDTIDDYIV